MNNGYQKSISNAGGNMKKRKGLCERCSNKKCKTRAKENSGQIVVVCKLFEENKLKPKTKGETK